MTYVGAPYAYGIVSLASGCGPLSLRAVVGIGSLVIWPGVQSFWSYQGTVVPMASDVGDWLFSIINRQMVGRTFGTPNPQFTEVWWDFPDEGALECNRYVALNYSDKGLPWTIGVRTRTAGDPTGTMDFAVLAGPAGAGGALYLHDYGWLEDGQPRAANGDIYAETGAIVMGEGDQRYHVTQVVPDAALGAAGMLGFRFFASEEPMGPEQETGLYTVWHEGLLDVRLSGRSVRMRIEATADGPFALGRTRLLLKSGGRR
jgi:hypothetical protein